MNDSSAQSSPNGPRAGRPGAEKSIVALLAALALGAAPGCQTRDEGKPAAPPPPAPAAAPPRPSPPAGAVDVQYAADIDALCNAIERAHADGLASQEQQVTVAMWLGDHIHTAAARAFLVKVQPLVGNAKADALDAERARAGLAACPLAAVWRASDTGSAK